MRMRPLNNKSTGLTLIFNHGVKHAATHLGYTTHMVTTTSVKPMLGYITQLHSANGGGERWETASPGTVTNSSSDRWSGWSW